MGMRNGKLGGLGFGLVFSIRIYFKKCEYVTNSRPGDCKDEGKERMHSH